MAEAFHPVIRQGIPTLVPSMRMKLLPRFYHPSSSSPSQTVTVLEYFFAVYETGVFFPITNATELIERTNTTVTTVVGSPVLAATVGPGLNFSELEESVRILLWLNEQGPVWMRVCLR